MKTSVALCTYNGEKFLKEQLESIFSQTVSPDEIVICDDGSSDNTLQILEKYAETHPSLFKIFRNKKNLGYTRNFEKAISLCSGDLIFLCDQDDIWLPNKTEQMTKLAESNPEKTVFCHNIAILTDDGKITKRSFWESDGFDPNFENNEILKYLLFKRNIFPGMSMCITKKAKEKYLPLKNIDPIIIHDYELVLKSCRNNNFYIHSEILTNYRKHSQQNIGFDLESQVNTPQNIIGIYFKIKRIKFVEKAVEQLRLDQSLISEYRDFCRKEYNDFIETLPFPKNWITHLKMKHYYKVLNELR